MALAQKELYEYLENADYSKHDVELFHSDEVQEEWHDLRGSGKDVEAFFDWMEDTHGIDLWEVFDWDAWRNDLYP